MRRFIYKLINNKLFKNIAMIVFGLCISVLYLSNIIYDPSSILSLFKVRGPGGYSMQIFTLIVGLVFIYFGIKGLIKK